VPIGPPEIRLSADRSGPLGRFAAPPPPAKLVPDRMREEPEMSIFATLGAYAGLLLLVLMAVTPLFADREL